MLLSEAFQKFIQWRSFGVGKSSLSNDVVTLRHFCIFLRNPGIENITLENILEWLGWLKFMGFDAVTLEKRVNALKKFFEFFAKKKYEVMDFSLIPRIPKEYKMPRVASEENYRKLIAIIPKNTTKYWHIRNLAMITLVWSSGARLGEALSLNVPDLNLEKTNAIIKTEKTRGRRPFRQIFWTEDTNENLKKWLKKREEMRRQLKFEDPAALFIGIKSGICAFQKYKEEAIAKRLELGAAGEVLRKYSRLAGLKRTLNAHSIRHHFGRELAKKGANNSTISNLLGHSDLSSSYIYTMMFGRELEEEYRKFRGE